MTTLARRRTPRSHNRLSDTSRTEYLAFSLAGDIYGVKISMIKEILRPPPITEVPRGPRAVIGVVMHKKHTRRMVITEREFNQIDKNLRIAISNPEPGIRVYEIHDTGEGDVVVVN